MRNVTGVAATDVITTKDLNGVAVRHGLLVGNRVVFSGLSGGTGLTSGTTYYVQSVPSDSTLKVSATRGGAAVNFSSDITAGKIARRITAALRINRTRM